jgi:hypothetical protein
VAEKPKEEWSGMRYVEGGAFCRRGRCRRNTTQASSNRQIRERKGNVLLIIIHTNNI